MSSMIAQKIAVDYTARIQSLISITPIPASGAPRSLELFTFLEEAALHGGEGAVECIHVLTNRRYSDFIAQKILEQWHSCSHAKARLSYLHMFSHTDFSKKAEGLITPMLVLLGDQDAQEQEMLLHKSFLQDYPNVQVDTCKQAGHFPVQETPLYLASRITHFLATKEMTQPV